MAKLSAVGISDNVFRYCKLLNSVSAPGCREFGYKAFAECCSLQWVYASEGAANWFSSKTKLGHHLFQGCINLAGFTLCELPSPRGPTLQDVNSELAPGCLSFTGITTLEGFSVALLAQGSKLSGDSTPLPSLDRTTSRSFCPWPSPSLLALISVPSPMAPTGARKLRWSCAYDYHWLNFFTLSSSHLQINTRFFSR